jgi:CubicO group peptidase (beta-lactamase class C family)
MTLTPDTAAPPPKVASLLAKIADSPGVSRPRAFITDADGSPLLDWGDTTLPVIVTGLTKLVTIAMILREFDRGAMAPDTPVSELLSEDVLSGLCVVRDQDYSSTLTVEHLLSHRSGIVDFLEPPAKKVRSLFGQALIRDRAWTLDQALEIAKHYPGLFRPGAKNKTHYSNTNYAMLGAILQESTGMTFEQLVTLRIVTSLGFKSTYVFTPSHVDRYFSLAPLQRGSEVLRLPRVLSSLGASGGLITTAQEMTRFLRAFWSDELFGPQWRDYLTAEPLTIERGLRMSRGLMMTSGPPSVSGMVGQAGATGSAALIDPATGMVGVLALNHLTSRAQTLQVLARLMATVAKHSGISAEPRRRR